MAIVIKTPAGTWKALIRKQGWPATSKTFRVKRDADDWARRTEDEMVRGVFIERTQAERSTVGECLDRYLREVSPTKKAFTERGERAKAAHLRAFFGSYSMAAVSASLVAEYRDQRTALGKSNNTVRLELALLSHLFTVAIREWQFGLTYNPVANVRKPTPGAGRNRRLVGNEQERLFKALAGYSNPMLEWIPRIALETGMRATEIATMRLGQVNLAKRTVQLDDTKNGSARTVPLSREAAKILRCAIDNPVRPKDTDLVFFGEPGRDGERAPYAFNKAWITLKKSIGLADLHFHDLRHEAVSRLVEAGLSDQEVSAISGHKSMQMLKRYTHLRAEDLVERLDRIDTAPRSSARRAAKKNRSRPAVDLGDS
jgi:integrase